MFVSKTTRPPTTLMVILLLVMSTLQPFVLSSTVQSTMVPGIMHHKIMHSNLSNIIITPNRTTLSPGLLSQTSSDLSPSVQQCIDSINPKRRHSLILECFGSNEAFFKILEERVHKTDAEYQCKSKFCRAYCSNLAARAYCTPDQHADYFKVLQQELDSAAKGDCKQWTDYLPPMDPTPLDVSQIDQCEGTDKKIGAAFRDCLVKLISKIGKDIEYPIMDIQDRTDYECKLFTGRLNCMFEQACKHCKSANKFVHFYGVNYWSLAKVECTKFLGPKTNCAAFHIPLIVGIVLLVVVTILVVIGVAVYFRCYPSGKSSGSSSKDDDDGSCSVSKAKAPNPAESSVDAKQSNQA